MEGQSLPSRWEKVRFGAICEVQTGFAFKSVDYVDEGIPLVRIGNLKAREVDLDNSVVYLSSSYASKYSRFVLRQGDVLIALSGATTGKMAIYDYDGEALLKEKSTTKSNEEER